MIKPSVKFCTKAIPYEECIAKKNSNGETVSVRQHCIAAGFVATELKKYDNIYNPCRAKMYNENYAYIAAIHDIGKISDQFTYEIDRSILDKYDNTVYSELGNKTKSEYFSSCNITRFSHNEVGAIAYDILFGNRKYISEIIRFHHGEFVSSKKFEIRGKEFEFDNNHIDQYRRLENELCRIFNFNEHVSYKPFSRYFHLGLTMICDHIASNEKYFPLVEMDIPELKKCAEKAVKDIFMNCTDSVIHGLSFKDIFGFDMRSVQNDFCSFTNTRGIYVFESDAGIGKTEASLYSVYENICRKNTDGLVFLLPTCLTSNKIYERVVKFINTITCRSSVNLVHGNSYMYKNEVLDILNSDESLSDWFNGNGHQLLPNFIVGTVDQGIMSTMKTKWSAIKIFSLSGKTIVIDELHTYDKYTSTLIHEMSDILHHYFGCTVIGMSASLPSSYRHKFTGVDNRGGDFPLLVDSNGRECVLSCSVCKNIGVSYGNRGNPKE